VKEEKRHIIFDSKCPSEDILERYSAGLLDVTQTHEVEDHLAGCEMCRDYLEGLSLLPPGFDLESVEKELKGKMHELVGDKEKKKRLIIYYRRFAIAASFLLLVSLTGYFLLKQKPINREVAEVIEPVPIVKEPVKVSSSTGINRVETEQKAVDDTKVDKNKTVELSGPLVASNDLTPKEGPLISRDIEINEVATIDSVIHDMAAGIAITPEKKEPVLAVEGDFDKKGKKGDQEIIINGKIEDPNGEPLIGVNIFDKLAMRGSVSDIDGKFELKSTPGETLQISMIGYKDLTVKADSGNMHIVLYPEEISLNEVVVLGYGVQKKSQVTGSSSSISGKSIITETRRQNKKIEKLEEEYSKIYENLDDEWVNTKYQAELSLIRKETLNSQQHLGMLLKITTDEKQQQHIIRALELTGKGKYRQAYRLIHPMKKK
jgi:hypothetical protein